MTIDELNKQINEKVEARNKMIEGTRKLADADNADLNVINKRMSDIDKAKTEIDDLKNRLEKRNKIDALKIEQNKSSKNGDVRKLTKVVEKSNKEEERAALNKFVHTKGQVRDGLTSADAGVLIPESIVFQPENQVKTTYDLKQYVNVINVTTPSGHYPVLAKVTDRLFDVEELAQNPELAKPKFNPVAWNVSTKRGALAISQESIDDAQADVAGIVADQINQLALNTNNYYISSALKTFAPKATADVDAIKHVINVDLDPAYNKSVVASQSFFQALDQVKDGNGRYLLSDNIASATGRTLLGLPLIVVADDLIGTKAGDAVAFIGDLKRAILFADRKLVSLEWANNDIYGQYLAGVMRFDVEVADAAAGYYVAFGNEAPEVTTTTTNK